MSESPFLPGDSDQGEPAFEPLPPWGIQTEQHSADENVELGVDITAAKASIRVPLEKVTVPDPASSPASGRELWERVKRSMLTFVARSIDLLPAAVETAHDILADIRGITRLPQAMGQALTRGREKAIATEQSAQRDQMANMADLSQESASRDAQIDTAVNAIEAILLQLRARGIDAQVQEMGNGKFAVVAVRPEVVSESLKIADEALEEFDESQKIAIKAEALFQLRSTSQLTQKELAIAVGVSASTISRIENGEKTTVSADVLNRLAIYLGVSTAALK